MPLWVSVLWCESSIGLLCILAVSLRAEEKWSKQLQRRPVLGHYYLLWGRWWTRWGGRHDSTACANLSFPAPGQIYHFLVSWQGLRHSGELWEGCTSNLRQTQQQMLHIVNWMPSQILLTKSHLYSLLLVIISHRGKWKNGDQTCQDDKLGFLQTWDESHRSICILIWWGRSNTSGWFIIYWESLSCDGMRLHHSFE